jgi:hypothetical protein
VTIKSSSFVPALFALLVLPLTAAATTPPPVAASGEYNGHYYEVIAYPSSGSPDKTWPTASSAANASTYEYTSGMSINGHLATITSSGEDAFIDHLRIAAGLHQPEAWVGGFQSGTPCGSPDCNWTWVNGEGGFIYSNWLDHEPNDHNGEEEYLGVGLSNAYGWNDERSQSNIGGYVIEYDVPIDAGECVSGEEGCSIGVGTTITLPDTVELTEMAQIDTRRYEFTDDPALCGTTKRLLFGPLTDPGDLIPDAILPAHLCGSPKFMVIVANTSGIEIPQGTILVENKTGDVFPENLYDCTGPNNPDAGNPLLDPANPQNRDVMAWQTTDYRDMPENDLGLMHGFEGSVGTFTYECGSSRGKGNRGSLYFIGMHIDFGPVYDDYAMNSTAINTQFALLTRYKLHVLQNVIRESKVSLRDTRRQRFGHWALKHLIRHAIHAHDRGSYEVALYKLRIIDWVLGRLTYTAIADENYHGATDMRTSNAMFMYMDKVIEN